MSPELQDKAVLITGGARRVGACIARRLHSEGARIAIHYRGSGKSAAALCEEFNALRPHSAVALQADLLYTEGLPTLVDGVLGAFGRLDVLVNNASSFYQTPVGEITEAHWHDLIGTNLKVPVFLTQAAAPALADAGGLVLNITDIHGLRPLKRFPVYSAAKAGLTMLTQSLARELAPQVRVNAIAPGPVMFPEHGLTDEKKQEIIDRTLLKRAGSPEDIAKAALFFVRDAPFVTGQILAVDGGRSVNA